MGKRSKGRGKGRHHRVAMTRREAAAKHSRHADDEQDPKPPAADEQPPDSESAEAGDDSTPPDDSEPAPDSASGPASSDPGHHAPPASDPEAEDDGADDGEPPSGPAGAPWAAPLVKLERGWTWLETRVLFIALMALTLVLCVWLSLRGMKEPVEATESAGTIFRAIVGAALLGGLSRPITRKLDLQERWRSVVTVVAVALGVAVAGSWRGVGVAYFSGLFDWLQEGSTLTLMGGLKGVSTRLTMTVALVGASLAASAAGHINIDVVVRIIPTKLRKLVHIVGTFATALICLLAAWGLFDHVAVTEYDVDADKSAGQKIGAVTSDLGVQWFMWRKQLGLDLHALPDVLGGERYNAKGRMNGRQWNQWLDEAGFVERFGEKAVAAVRASEVDLDADWEPFAVLPGGEARGMLLKGMDLLFPFGFLMIGLRFLLRALLVLAGCIDLAREAGEDELDDLDEPHRGGAAPSAEEAS